MADRKETVVHEEQAAQPGAANRRKLLFVGLALLLGALIYFLLPVDPAPQGKSAEQVRTGLAILALAGILWLTEALPLAVTALLIPVAAALSGVFAGNPKTIVTESFSKFADPLIFLFLGGFGIAAALSRQGLDRWIADRILLLAKGRFRASAYALFLVSAGLSMWISNTATVALLLPVALGILADLKLRADQETVTRVAPFLLLGIAYSASIGGIGTKVGSPPNGIAAQALGMNFTDWMRIGLPCVAILLPCLFLLLTILARPGKVPRLKIEPVPFSFNASRVGTLLIFLLAIAGWLSSSFLSAHLDIEKGFDTLVAITALILLSACGFVRWRDIDKTTDWGVLLVFGGGLTLSKILGTTGASEFLANRLEAATAGLPFFLIVGAVVLFVIFLTELSSNTATAALFVPIFYTVAVQMGLEPTRFVLPLAVAASCAFMLPVATPPNAIVFGSGRIPQRTMMRIGLVLNLVFALILTVLSAVLF